jgi:hypothetical protein
VKRNNGSFPEELYLSDRPISPERVISLRKIDPSTDPEWAHLVWAFEYRPSKQNEASGPYLYHFKNFRIWDNIVLMGDPALLDHMEELRATE